MMTMMTAGIWPAITKELPNDYCLQGPLATTNFSILVAQHNEAAAGPRPKDDYGTSPVLAVELLLSRLHDSHDLPRPGQLLLLIAAEPANTE